MRIAVVGAGIAGLAAAWLLDGDHQVALFERNDFLGGHARTIHFEYRGKRAHANPAFGYVAVRMYPHFIRLLDILGVKRVPSPASVTVYSKTLRKSAFVTPTLSPLRLSPIFNLSQLVNLISVQRIMQAAKVLDERDDWQTTLEEFVEGLKVSTFVKNQIVYPWIAAMGGVPIVDIKTFSARAALKYPVHVQPESVLRPFSLEELDGGVAAYIEPFIKTLRTTEIRKSVDLQAIHKEDGQFILRDETGTQQRFDHLILATPAYEAVKLMNMMPNTEHLQVVLRRFPYNQTRIVVHSDPRYMPARRAEWSIYNALVDGPNSEATIWCRESGEFDYFKSWMSFTPETPQNVHAEFAFHHPLLTPDYYRAQTDLSPFQGQDNLWFAGSYVVDVDSHESGIRSAIAVARQLNPQSRNLARLM